jgi:hypothetical protein
METRKISLFLSRRITIPLQFLKNNHCFFFILSHKLPFLFFNEDVLLQAVLDSVAWMQRSHKSSQNPVANSCKPAVEFIRDSDLLFPCLKTLETSCLLEIVSLHLGFTPVHNVEINAHHK